MKLLRNIFASDLAGSFLLLAMTAVAIVLANGPLGDAYRTALAWIPPIPVTHHGEPLSLLLWVNDGLMAVFFLLVALELKRNLIAGELSGKGRAVLPAIAAVGGMAVPSLIYVLVAWAEGDPVATRGWAIPAATDIAFALGVLGIVGRGLPPSLRIFLTALAVLDDLGAIVIIALFYSTNLDLPWLGAAVPAMAVLIALNRGRVSSLWPYLLVGCGLWYCLLQSGIHSTIAGVLTGLAVPYAHGRGQSFAMGETPLRKLEHALHKPVAFVILPLFALANAGVSLKGIEASDFLGPVPLGIALGLLVGKQVGVFSFAWATVRLGLAPMPSHASWRQLHGVAILCGIGFTMSLFIGDLAFRGVEGGDAYETRMKVGVLTGSILSALVGAIVLRFTPKAEAVQEIQPPPSTRSPASAS
jgi:NhaA family Na+:H+ antiporter